MRLVSFSDAESTRIGVHDAQSNTIVDITRASRLPKDMTSFVALGKNGLQRARRAVKSGEHRIAYDSVKILAPFPRPAKNILCVGKNYHDHAKEFHNSGFDASAGADAIPELPIMFTKWPNSVIANKGKPVGRDKTSKVFYWVVPAKAAGKWRWRVADGGTQHDFELALNQNFQKVEATLTADGKAIAVEDAKLSGDTLTFVAKLDGGTRQEYSGRIVNHGVDGTVRTVKSGGAPQQAAWSAARTETWEPRHYTLPPPTLIPPQ